jgi:hypothetical protein
MPLPPPIMGHIHRRRSFVDIFHDYKTVLNLIKRGQLGGRIAERRQCFVVQNIISTSRFPKKPAFP